MKLLKFQKNELKIYLGNLDSETNINVLACILTLAFHVYVYMRVYVDIFCEKGAMKVEKSVTEEGNRVMEHMRQASRKEAARSGREQGWRWRGEVEKQENKILLENP